MSTDAVIAVDRLGKRFGSKAALLPVSFKLARGQTIGIVGPSGGGKTTLLRCVAGLIRDFDGEITLESQPHSQYLKAHRVAMIFQKYANFEWLTVLDNLREAFAVSGAKGESTEACVSMLASLGLNEWAGAYVSQLSGGMQQRVALGRSLLQNQAIVGLDEPFAALDIRNRWLMQDLVKKSFHEQDRTALFVTHDVSEAVYVSDVVMLVSGTRETHGLTFESPFGNTIDQSVKTSSEFLALQNAITSVLL